MAVCISTMLHFLHQVICVMYEGYISYCTCSELVTNESVMVLSVSLVHLIVVLPRRFLSIAAYVEVQIAVQQEHPALSFLKCF